MSNPRQKPVTNPKQFIGSVFDLAYGSADETLTSGEVKEQLRESGVDPDASWKDFQALLQPKPQAVSLADVRKRRMASAPPLVVPVAARPRKSILEEIDRLLASLGPKTAGVFGRNWRESSETDLEALCTQLRRQIARNQTDDAKS